MLIGPLATNFNEILIEIHTFSFKKMYLKISSAKGRLFSLGLDVLTEMNGNTRVWDYGLQCTFIPTIPEANEPENGTTIVS